jgi:hypothetical protein
LQRRTQHRQIRHYLVSSALVRDGLPAQISWLNSYNNVKDLENL